MTKQQNIKNCRHVDSRVRMSRQQTWFNMFFGATSKQSATVGSFNQSRSSFHRSEESGGSFCSITVRRVEPFRGDDSSPFHCLGLVKFAPIEAESDVVFLFISNMFERKMSMTTETREMRVLHCPTMSYPPKAINMFYPFQGKVGLPPPLPPPPSTFFRHWQVLMERIQAQLAQRAEKPLAT